MVSDVWTTLYKSIQARRPALGNSDASSDEVELC